MPSRATMPTPATDSDLDDHQPNDPNPNHLATSSEDLKKAAQNAFSLLQSSLNRVSMERMPSNDDFYDSKSFAEVDLNATASNNNHAKGDNGLSEEESIRQAFSRFSDYERDEEDLAHASFNEDAEDEAEVAPNRLEISQSPSASEILNFQDSISQPDSIQGGVDALEEDGEVKAVADRIESRFLFNPYHESSRDSCDAEGEDLAPPIIVRDASQGEQVGGSDVDAGELEEVALDDIDDIPLPTVVDHDIGHVQESPSDSNVPSNVNAVDEEEFEDFVEAPPAPNHQIPLTSQQQNTEIPSNPQEILSELRKELNIKTNDDDKPMHFPSVAELKKKFEAQSAPLYANYTKVNRQINDHKVNESIERIRSIFLQKP